MELTSKMSWPTRRGHWWGLFLVVTLAHCSYNVLAARPMPKLTYYFWPCSLRR